MPRNAEAAQSPGKNINTWLEIHDKKYIIISFIVSAEIQYSQGIIHISFITLKSALNYQ